MLRTRFSCSRSAVADGKTNQSFCLWTYSAVPFLIAMAVNEWGDTNCAYLFAIDRIFTETEEQIKACAGGHGQQGMIIMGTVLPYTHTVWPH